MIRYLIHTCNDRNWYVNEYLIPSMVEQGIDRNNIDIYLDKNNEGCLVSCMKAFSSVISDGHTWHLQDDVIICSDFKERTEKEYEESIVCGYCYEKDGRKDYVGRVNPKEMWYSFPCIRISNRVARSCARWYFNYAQFQRCYQIWIKMKKYDDSMFEIYLQDYDPDVSILNLKPNLVDHVDYLIGGSVINDMRPEKETHALYFDEKYLLKKLEVRLKNS